MEDQKWQSVSCKVVVYVGSFRGVSDVRYSRCSYRAKVNVGLRVGIDATVSVRVLVVVCVFLNV